MELILTHAKQHLTQLLNNPRNANLDHCEQAIKGLKILLSNGKINEYVLSGYTLTDIEKKYKDELKRRK